MNEVLIMTEQNARTNKLAVIGFIISLAAPVLFGISYVFYNNIIETVSKHLASYLIVASAFIMPVAALVFSIIGLIISSKRKQKGKGFAIASLIMSGLEILGSFGGIFLLLSTAIF